MQIATIRRRIERLRPELEGLEDERRRWAIRQVMDYHQGQADTARIAGVSRSRVNQWIREDAARHQAARHFEAEEARR